MNMKNIYTRFLAIVAVVMMAFGCTMVAHAEEENPYQSSYYDAPTFGVVVSFDPPVLTEPSDDAAQIGMLNSGTICRILGKYDNNGYVYYIIDLTVLDGFDTEYGFVRTSNICEYPQWVMLTNPVNTYTSPWTNGFRSFTGLTGLAVVLEEDERYYAIQHVDHPGITSFISKKRVKPYSPEGQELYLLPIDTMIYDDFQNPIRELPAMTVLKSDNWSGYDPVKGLSRHVTANPGTEDEISGWVYLEYFMAIIN